jgi:hypothetical protein
MSMKGFCFLQDGRCHTTYFVCCMPADGDVRRLRLLTVPSTCQGSALDPDCFRKLDVSNMGMRSMVFKKKDADGLDAIINVRTLPAEKEQLQFEADLASMSLSALVRARITGKPIIAKADEMVIKELRRLGGLLKMVHNETNGAHSVATAEAIKRLSEYVTRLSKS